MKKIELTIENAENILKVLENHTSLCFAIVSQDIKNIVTGEAYDELSKLFLNYHNASCGPFNRSLKKLIDESKGKHKTSEEK